MPSTDPHILATRNKVTQELPLSFYNAKGGEEKERNNLNVFRRNKRKYCSNLIKISLKEEYGYDDR